MLAIGQQRHQCLPVAVMEADQVICPTRDKVNVEEHAFSVRTHIGVSFVATADLIIRKKRHKQFPLIVQSSACISQKRFFLVGG